jgi:arylsulfatase A
MHDGSAVPGGKGLTLDRGNRVPLIVYRGNTRYLSHQTNDLIDFTDVLPTIADLMGTKIPKTWDTDGISFAPQINGKKGTKRPWVFVHYSPLLGPGVNQYAARFFRDHRYKLYHDGRFYDLQLDPEEKHNIPKGSETSAARKIRAVFEKEFAKLPAWQPGDPGVPEVVLKGLEPVKDK